MAPPSPASVIRARVLSGTNRWPSTAGWRCRGRVRVGWPHHSAAHKPSKRIRTWPPSRAARRRSLRAPGFHSTTGPSAASDAQQDAKRRNPPCGGRADRASPGTAHSACLMHLGSCSPPHEEKLMRRNRNSTRSSFVVVLPFGGWRSHARVSERDLFTWEPSWSE